MAPVRFRVPSTTEPVWIDRFALELSRLGAIGSPEQLVELGIELWSTMHHLEPEEAARAEFDSWAGT